MIRALAAAVVLGASAAAAQAPVVPPGSTYRPDHAAEDWSALADPDRRTRPWHGAKWTSLSSGDGGSLTIGADAKLRWESVDRPLFGAAGAEPDAYLLKRVLAHADFRPNRNVQAFVQLGWHDSDGRRVPFPLDQGGLDLQQAFVELRGGAGERTHALRLGRQEMAFSPRFVNPRDGVNLRSAYDGARGWIVRGPWRAEAFATRPVANAPGDFDDEADAGQTFSGARLIYGFGRKRAWRVTGSVYRVDREAARLGALAGPDDRRSWGLRLAGAENGWDLDAELYRQTGRFAGRRIDAWGGGGDAGWTARDARWTPRIGLRWLFGSGDDDPADGTAQTFVGPFARPPCCADPLWLAPANIAVVGPVLSVKPTPRLQAEVHVDVITKLEEADSLYAVPMIAYPRTAGRAGGQRVSVAPTLTVIWTPTDELNLQLHHVEQTAEGALRAAGGRDSRFTAVSAAVQF